MPEHVAQQVCVSRDDDRIVALEYAEAITHTDRQVDDALFAKVKRHFTEPQIVELTAAIAFENFRSKFNPTLGVEAQGFCMVPKR